MQELAKEIIGDIQEGHGYMEYEAVENDIYHTVIVENEAVILVLENDETIATAKVDKSDFLEEIGVEYFQEWINSVWYYCGAEKEA